MYKPQNIIRQLADYIKKNLSKGYTEETLKFSLISQGYSKITIDRAIEVAHQNLAQTIPPIKEKPQIIYKIINQDNQPVQISETKITFLEKIKDFFN